MLSNRFRYDNKPSIPLNDLQIETKDVLERFVALGVLEEVEEQSGVSVERALYRLNPNAVVECKGDVPTKIMRAYRHRKTRKNSSGSSQSGGDPALNTLKEQLVILEEEIKRLEEKKRKVKEAIKVLKS